MMVTSQLYNTTELTEVIGSGGIDNILKDLYIDVVHFLKPIKEVRLAYGQN